MNKGRRGLENSLRELETRDPKVKATAQNYDRVKDGILGRNGGTHRFFEHGGVAVLNSDPKLRQASFRITIPASVAQTISPALLGAGVLDQYVLMNPLSAWMPSLGEERIKPEVSVVDPAVAGRVNSAVRAVVHDTLEAFRTLSQALIDPSDLIPMLPLGVYVIFRFRCQVDDVPGVLSELGRTTVAGTAEFRYALAAALAEVLLEFKSVIAAAPDSGR